MSIGIELSVLVKLYLVVGVYAVLCPMNAPKSLKCFLIYFN